MHTGTLAETRQSYGLTTVDDGLSELSDRCEDELQLMGLQKLRKCVEVHGGGRHRASTSTICEEPRQFYR
jgi:hypothetical protein